MTKKKSRRPHSYNNLLNAMHSLLQMKHTCPKFTGQKTPFELEYGEISTI